MPNLFRALPRRQLLQRCLLAIPIFAFIAGSLPVLAVLIFGSNGSATTTAYASAPSGTYIVAAVAGAEEDTILVVSAADPSVQFRVAGVAHAPEVPTMGTVSPDGLQLALIVVEPGAPSEAVASLYVIDLMDGTQTRLLSQVDFLQRPVWAADNESVVVVRSRRGTTAGSNVALMQASLNRDQRTLWVEEDTIAAYPVGFNANGDLIAVRIDGSGSSAVMATGSPVPLTPYYSRDWQLNSDGTAIAFIETNLESGLKYVPKVVALTAGGGGVSGQGVAGGEALGTAWAPASPNATFGYEPVASTGPVSAQSRSGGFDVPLAYSPDGDALAAWHWSGSSFDEPGVAALVIDAPQGRVLVAGVSRFFGWATR